ncbi:MAG: hypothetical protein EOO04_11105 [Chitinophagaceae bacterium]|nr:MAG: hypothetical protein EOO04_11105 [Chitinophagaceae bacterium]
MNYNVFAYGFYLLMMIIIIVFVGKFFHTNGRIFILNLFRGNIVSTDVVNNLLLVAYYLFNIGYALVTLRYWEQITSLDMLIADISHNMGTLILILSVTHYVNLTAIYCLSKSTSFLISKPFQS